MNSELKKFLQIVCLILFFKIDIYGSQLQIQNGDRYIITRDWKNESIRSLIQKIGDFSRSNEGRANVTVEFSDKVIFKNTEDIEGGKGTEYILSPGAYIINSLSLVLYESIFNGVFPGQNGSSYVLRFMLPNISNEVKITGQSSQLKVEANILERITKFCEDRVIAPELSEGTVYYTNDLPVDISFDAIEGENNVIMKNFLEKMTVKFSQYNAKINKVIVSNPLLASAYGNRLIPKIIIGPSFDTGLFEVILSGDNSYYNYDVGKADPKDCLGSVYEVINSMCYRGFSQYFKYNKYVGGVEIMPFCKLSFAGDSGKSLLYTFYQLNENSILSFGKSISSTGNLYRFPYSISPQHFDGAKIEIRDSNTVMMNADWIGKNGVIELYENAGLVLNNTNITTLGGQLILRDGASLTGAKDSMSNNIIVKDIVLNSNFKFENISCIKFGNLIINKCSNIDTDVQIPGILNGKFVIGNKSRVKILSPIFIENGNLSIGDECVVEFGYSPYLKNGSVSIGRSSYVIMGSSAIVNGNVHIGQDSQFVVTSTNDEYLPNFESFETFESGVILARQSAKPISKDHLKGKLMLSGGKRTVKIDGNGEANSVSNLLCSILSNKGGIIDIGPNGAIILPTRLETEDGGKFPQILMNYGEIYAGHKSAIMCRGISLNKGKVHFSKFGGQKIHILKQDEE